MIVTEQKPIQEIIDSLNNYLKIFLVGCGECAATCRTGGEPEVLRMKQRLEEAGKTVVGYCVPDAPCIASQIKTGFAKNIKALRTTEVILVLACGLGVQSVKENDRFGLVVLPACNTLFGAIIDTQGNILEKCSMCGKCVLAETNGICPFTLCPKGILNGPCGGTDKGKCEVDKDKDCAWVLIYKELEKRKKLNEFRKIKEPRDFNKTLKPQRIMVAK